jgi:aryl-alcohol dehydrogenase-like predicted oxidoreductase
MKTVTLGNTGEQVSALCLGAMYYGSRVETGNAYRLLDQYLDAGGSFIDTANIYAWWVEGFRGGESETLLGEWMKERQNRSRLFLASKVGFGYGGVPVGLSADRIVIECEKSLRWLGIETIDLYYAHVDDRHTPIEETMEAFNQLVQQGKVRYVGASNYRAWRLEEANMLSQVRGWAQYQCIQQRYTYLQPRAGASFGAQVAANDDLLDYCRNRPVTLLAYSPLLAGAYTHPDKSPSEQYHSPDNRQRLDTLRAVAEELNASLNQVVLAWMLHSNPLVLPVFSASTPEQMQEDLAALELVLNVEQRQRLNTAGTRADE